jgi:hypothetical protein
MAGPSIQTLHSGYWAPVFNLNPHSEIVPVDVERDIKIAGMQMRPHWVMEELGFATSQYHPADGFGIPTPTFQKIA